MVDKFCVLLVGLAVLTVLIVVLICWVGFSTGAVGGGRECSCVVLVGVEAVAGLDLGRVEE